MKRIYLMLISIFTCSISLAQTEIDTTFFTKMNYIFSNLDKSKVPNGILRDFAMEFTNVENYNGTVALADSNYVDAQAFWDVYQTLLTGRISATASGFVSPAIVDSLWYIQRDTGLIVLGGLYFNYSRFKDNAANNYVTISNGQLYDKYVGGVWQNPYQGEKAFLLSPPINGYSELNLKIVLPANLWFTNNGAAVTSLQIDANDGLGYRTLTAGVPLNVSYADTGHKEWKYKLTINGTATLYSHSDMYIQTNYSVSGGGQYRLMSPQGVSDFSVYSFTASQSYLGIAGKGYARIKYANPDHVIRKPIIVAEGFDPGHIMKPEEKFGERSLKDFLDDVGKSNSYDLISLLDGTPSEYDIIYVDWENGTDYLQRNAYLLETIIQWVNDNKQPLGGVVQPNVVLGQSMGGVVARYALKDMENNSINHETRLYISDDAPHLGANVPQGFQHLARHARGLYIRAGITTIWIEIVQLIRGRMSPIAALSLANQPASKQMLITYVNDNNNVDNSVHNAWQTELKNMGYPQGVSGIPFRKVAISNGSECASPQLFNAGDNLLTYNGRANTRFLGDMLGMGLLPAAGILLGQPLLLGGIIPGRNDLNFDFYVNAQADGTSNHIYHGKITYTKSILWLVPVTVTLTNRNYTSNASTLPYDYFPGGYYNTGLDFTNNSYQDIFVKFKITASNQPTFNFVPTVSALDIGGGNLTLSKADYLARYVGATPPAAPKNSPFDNFITAFNNDKINEQHISIERRNGDWMAAELNGTPQSADCSGVCDIKFISGPESFCDIATFSVPLVSGASYTWTVDNSFLVNTSANNNEFILTRRRSGSFLLTITVVINAGECGVFTETKTVQMGNTFPTFAGPYDVVNHTIMGVTCKGQQYYYVATDNPAGQTYTWTLFPPPGSSDLPSMYSGSTVYLTFNETGYYTLRLSKTNSCNTTMTEQPINVQECVSGFSIIVAPNPASDVVTVSIVNETDEVKSLSKSENIKIELYQFNTGAKQKHWAFKNQVKQMTLNLNTIPKGIYILKVTKGKYSQSEKVVIE